MPLKSLLLSALAALPLASSQLPVGTLRNPVLWEDHPDLDVFRIGNVYYYSSSTFAYSPGAPLLRSYDLANWEPVSHSVPTLNFGAKYALNGSRAYVKGIWASTLRYKEKDDVWIWMGCVEGRTYVWTASGTQAGRKGGEVDPGAWAWKEGGSIASCYYDAGLLVDEEVGRMFVVYGNPRITVAEVRLEGDGSVREVVPGKVVYEPGYTVEGARMYRKGNDYYILITRPADQEIVLRSTNGPYGPYTAKTLVNRISGPLTNAGFAHQGGMVDTPDGRWFYVAFLDAYPGGRIPVVAPMTWGSDGFPKVVVDSKGAWAQEYPIPVNTTKTVTVSTGTDEFKGKELSHHWEWNHNPENTKWRLSDGGGLVLQTVDVTTDLFAARNTLTRRIIGPKSSGTFRLDVSGMKDGDKAGAVLFRDRSAYIGRTAVFSYSVDGGKTFVRLGPAALMVNSWQYFTGYRFGVFNHATKALGGEVKVKSFTLAKI
ncbi:glycosyl hydrolase [Cercophora newfieldiana]|uniref:Glycosyl hydrolase n=1 Tax=Cercophora newfieldiana TaxID=92897 RepID=A0AA39Y253_9PEZI|nr:glycosyl hydrolase [Cercophora newfieldiana]